MCPDTRRQHRPLPFRRPLLAALLGSGLLLSGCATFSEPPRQPEWPAPDNLSDQNLPVDSTIFTPSGTATDDSLSMGSSAALEAEQPLGSLRPDDATAAERVPTIINRGRLIVGVGQSLNRLGYRDPLTGELAGFEVDLAREIARDIFDDPDRVEFRYVDSRDREEALRSGRVDVVLRTMTITRERQLRTEFSIPYLAVHSRLLVMRNSGIEGFGDLDDKRVCVTADSTSARLLEKAPVGSVLTTRTWTDCLMAIQRHQVDAVFTDDAILSGLQAQDPYTTIVGDNVDPGYYGVAAATNRPTENLIRQVNSTLERVRADGTWNKLYRRWLQNYIGAPTPLPTDYRSDAESAKLRAEREAQ